MGNYLVGRNKAANYYVQTRKSGTENGCRRVLESDSFQMLTVKISKFNGRPLDFWTAEIII